MAVWASVVLSVISLSLAAGSAANGRQDVARDKPAWMSTTRQISQSAAKAVDGVTTAVNETYSVHTSVYEATAWWKVDLQTPVQSPLVNIYFRTDYKRRRNGLQLFSSMTNSSDPKEGDLCHTVIGRGDGTDIPDILNVTCPGTWRYLTVYTETDNDGAGAALDFVEVQVWICDPGYYGAKCVHRCDARHCKMDSSCDFAGRCVDGCTAGYLGKDCTQVCPRGRYGEGCNKNCSSQCKPSSNTCDHVSGRCPNGCTAGYTGDDCLQICSTGMYGEGCSKTCSNRHCKPPSNTCHHVTGTCPDGCTAGYRGDDCLQTCVSGVTYGDRCSKTCNSRHCVNNMTSCPPNTGACPNGICQTGWAGTDCTACATPYYGANCDQSCAARHCKMDSVCDATQGECVGGCAAGYQGTDCRQVCDPGMYGEGCSKTCNNRHCKTPSNTCDHVTGRCPDGCISGFNGDDCLQNCPEGYYGTACSLSCEGRHCSSTSCPADGACGADCEAGWTLQSCTQECPRGKYGIGCNSVCGHCADNITCHHVTGTCPGGCQAGWKLPLCQTVCDNGTFGLNCERDCGHCKGTCDVVDGRCPLGCIEGYNGSHCSEKLSSLRDSSSVITPVTAGVIGLVAGVFVTVLLAVGLIVGLVRQGRLQWMNSAQKDEVNVRATSTQVDWNSTQPSDNYASISEQPSARNIYNNDYSTLDVEAKSDNDYDVIKNKEYENM